MWTAEGQGRIAVFGSVSMFDDKYIDKEENSKLMDFVFKWLRPVRGGADGCTACTCAGARSGASRQRQHSGASVAAFGLMGGLKTGGSSQLASPAGGAG